MKRGSHSLFTDDKSLRLRAAWLYHAHGFTQNDVAKKLGVGRSTAIRLLEEAQKRGEVRFWIADGEASLIDLALKLEAALAIGRVVVVPSAENFDDTARSVGRALGKLLSGMVRDHMTIGVGWGRALTSAMASFLPPSVTGVKVVSLLGGAVETRFSNPGEFAWKFAAALQAECFLFPAPLFVNSAETKRVLIEECGLSPLLRMVEKLDLAIVSAAGMDIKSDSYVRHLVSPQDHQALLKLGCVGDILCHFIDPEGVAISHPINNRVMAADLDVLKTAKHIIIATGGEFRAQAILAGVKRLRPHTLITDELAARALLSLLNQSFR